MYLFLLRIPLDVVHECLRLRLEQRPDRETEPSVLSIRQVRDIPQTHNSCANIFMIDLLFSAHSRVQGGVTRWGEGEVFLAANGVFGACLPRS